MGLARIHLLGSRRGTRARRPHHVPSDRGAAAIGNSGADGAVARLVGGTAADGPHAVARLACPHIES